MCNDLIGCLERLVLEKDVACFLRMFHFNGKEPWTYFHDFLSLYILFDTFWMFACIHISLVLSMCCVLVLILCLFRFTRNAITLCYRCGSPDRVRQLLVYGPRCVPLKLKRMKFPTSPVF